MKNYRAKSYFIPSDGHTFARLSATGFEPMEEENVCDSIFQQYERVIVESLITSFGLDFIVRDQHGGDVDTVLNVREIGYDDKMQYKNKQNKIDYETRDDYDYGQYHSDSRFAQKKHEARERWQATGENIPNEYRPSESVGFYGHTKSIPNDKKAELDHIVECKHIHDDRGRVLSGLSGGDLANSEDNLAFTDKSLNASIGAWSRAQNDKYKKEHGCDAPMELIDIKAYVKAHPDLDEKTKEQLIKHYEKAKKAYNRKIEIAYYTSPKFFKDTAKAAAKEGSAMGARQALGLVMSEVWFSIKEELAKPFADGVSLLKRIGEACKRGLVNAKKKYRELITKFLEGMGAGLLSSITTTLTNIFFTTAKNLVRILRQSWASLIEAAKTLLFNPDALPFGERMRATAKIVATGASVVVGTLVSETLAESAIGAMPVLGDIVQTFCGTLVTGILSCTLLYILDHDSRIAKIVNVLNSIPTVDKHLGFYQMEAQMLEEYGAKLMDIDLEAFQRETNSYYSVLDSLDADANECILNGQLKDTMEKLTISVPFKGPFDEYMNSESYKPLHFKPQS